jgi:hypothetical protein
VASDPYRAQAARAARKYGIPVNLFYGLIKNESGWRPGVTSPAGAVGLTQLMPATARGLGVDPYNPTQNLEGGARYLSQQYKRFGTWRQALAAYNAGPGRVQDGSWLKIPETTRYVRNVLGYLPAADKGAGSAVSPQNPLAAPTTPAPTDSPDPFQAPDLTQAVLGNLATPEWQQKADPGAALRNLTFSVAAQQSALASQPPSPGPQPQPQAQPVRPVSLKGWKAGLPIVGGTHGGEHGTSGLAGYTGVDYFNPAGSAVVAPVSGKVIKLSGHDPKKGAVQGAGGPLGWSIYIQAKDGRIYYLTLLPHPPRQQEGEGGAAGARGSEDRHGRRLRLVRTSFPRPHGGQECLTPPTTARSRSRSKSCSARWTPSSTRS